MAQILIIEDEVLLAKSLCRSMAAEGHDCVTANSAEEGLALLEKMPIDVVLLDLQLPGMSGLDAITPIKQIDTNISVIIATAYATMASAVEAMRSGACDFLRKPLDTEEVLLSVDRAIADAKLRQTVSYYHDLEVEKTDENRLVCDSPKMKKVVEMVSRVTEIDLADPSEHPPVLIVGETGVGKDLVARKIHYHGRFGDQPFIELNCTTLPSGLEEAELFGYERGAFTGADKKKRGLFEAASGGSIFLNEIGDLSLEAQAKLLQVIEQKCLRRVGGLRDIEVNVHIIAASNRKLVDFSVFREDLYYRLNNVIIAVPPLRERTEDIPRLAEMFLAKFGRKYGATKRLSEDALSAMMKYTWPGNVRELRQMLERISFLHKDETVSVSHLNLPTNETTTIKSDSLGQISISIPEGGVDIEEVERALIIDALKSCEGNVSEAARKLRLGREALRYRIKKFDISREISIIG